MSRFDHSDLDGHLLALLVAVVEERSVTRAAQRLGVSQSAVSHLLDKLRTIVGDPLVVRSGRGIVPTARAELLADRARPLLDDLRGFVSAGGFDPVRLRGPVVVAAVLFEGRRGFRSLEASRAVFFFEIQDQVREVARHSLDIQR